MNNKNNIILALAFSWLVFNLIGLEMRHVFPYDIFAFDNINPILLGIYIISLLFCVCYVGWKKIKLFLFVFLLLFICPRIDSWYKDNLIKEDPCIAYATCNVESNNRGRYSIIYYFNDTKGENHGIATTCSRKNYLLIKKRSETWGEILITYSKRRPDCSRISDWAPTNDSLAYYKALDSLIVAGRQEHMSSDNN